MENTIFSLLPPVLAALLGILTYAWFYGQHICRTVRHICIARCGCIFLEKEKSS